MLYDDMIYVNVENEIEVYNKQTLKNCNFQYIFLNLNISVNNGANFIKFGTLVLG